MNKRLIPIAVALALMAGGAYLYGQRSQRAGTPPDAESATGPDAGGERSDRAEGRPDTTTIGGQSASDMAIETLRAGPAGIRETVALTGRVSLNQNTTAQVKARFPGIVRSVAKGLGETVRAGDVLATVEGNDSLLVYPVRAPIGGVILARGTNIGDVAGDAPLFTIADLSDVWAELYVFPRDVGHMRAGQVVQVTSTDGGTQARAAIESLLPVAEASSQTVIARATLANPGAAWRAGMTVRGEVVVGLREVPVAVKTQAIQRLEGSNVVFTRDGESYSARKVELGAADRDFTEVRSGLEVGEEYVATNSFVVKADIGKSGAEHED